MLAVLNYETIFVYSNNKNQRKVKSNLHDKFY